MPSRKESPTLYEVQGKSTSEQRPFSSSETGDEVVIFPEYLSLLQRGVMLADALRSNGINDDVLQMHTESLDELSKGLNVPATVEYWQQEVKPDYMKRVNELFQGFYPQTENIDNDNESLS